MKRGSWKDYNARITASVNSAVPALPPTSPVRCFAFGVDRVDGAFEARGGLALAEVRQHQHGRLHQRGGIGQALAGDIGRGAVDGFEDGVVVADVGARHDPQPAHQAGGQVGDDVAIEVGQHQHIEGFGAHHQLHAGVVHDQLVVLNLGKAGGRSRGSTSETGRRSSS